MIANFFKQSKPIVFLILGILLSSLYFTHVYLNFQFSEDWKRSIIPFLNYGVLIVAFIFFELSTRRFEIQSRQSMMSLFFVLFTAVIIADISIGIEIIGFLIMSLGVIRLLKLTNEGEKNLYVFEGVLFISISSLFYKPLVLCLILVLVASLLFTKPKWRYFVIPVLSISTIVIFVESYFLLYHDMVVGIDFFMPSIEYSLEAYLLKLDPVLVTFWIILSLVCVYQIYSVKQIRSLYHRQMASFFLVFLILSLVSFSFKSSTLSGLWLMSIWPLSIYIGDFILRLKKRLWINIWFFGFTLISILIYIYRLA